MFTKTFNHQTQKSNNVECKSSNLSAKNNFTSMQTNLSNIELVSKLDNLNNSSKEMVRGMNQMPVSVLQHVLSHFSYNEVLTFFI